MSHSLTHKLIHYTTKIQTIYGKYLIMRCILGVQCSPNILKHIRGIMVTTKNHTKNETLIMRPLASLDMELLRFSDEPVRFSGLVIGKR